MTGTLVGVKGEEAGQNGTVGQNGLPGKPGNPGGKFYGIGEKFINPKALLIYVNGGKGGDGQEGGDGSDGMKGRKIPYVEWPSCYDFEYIFGKGFSTYFDAVKAISELKHEVWKYGGKGGVGGNGGNGGVKGLGGYSGIVNIQSVGTTNNLMITKKHDQGDSGKDGEGGKGGSGGERGVGVTATMFWFTSAVCDFYAKDETYQYNEFNTAGKRGEQGIYSTGKRMPTKPQFTTVDFKSVNEYTAFLLSQEKVELRNKFIQTLENRKHSLGLSNPPSFSQELLSLEQHSLILRQSKLPETSLIIMCPRYTSFLHRLENYSKTVKSLPVESKKALSILYTTALSRTNSFRNTLGPTIVVNIEGYLQSVLRKFRRLNDTTTEVVVEEERQEYAKTFQDKVKQAMGFIEEKVNPGIDEIEREMATASNELIQQIGKMEAENANKEAEAKAALEKAKGLAVFRHIFTALKIGASVVSFLGPVGAAAGGIIGTATSIGESFALPQDAKLRTQIPLPSAVKRYADNMESKWKERGDDELKLLDVTIDNAKIAAKDNNDLSDVVTEVKKLEEDKKEFKLKRRSMTQQEAASTSLDLTKRKYKLEKRMTEKLTNYEKAYKDKKTAETKKTELKAKIRKIQTFKNALTTAHELGFEVYNSYKNDEAKLEQLAGMVEKAGADLAKVRKYKERVNSELLPMIDEVGGDVRNAKAKMEGSSSVSLQVQKWGIKQKLTDFKFRLQDMTQGLAVRERFGHVIDKLTEAVSMTIELYDSIDKYNEQMRFADYIANINNPKALNIEIGKEISADISKIEMSLQSNILLGEYDRVVESFKQWVFPFGDLYYDDYNLSDDIQAVLNPNKEGGVMTPKEISLFLLPKLEKEVENLRSRVSEYKTRIFPSIDVKVIDAVFNSEHTSTDPFFIWGTDKQKEIRDLFSGKPVSLVANSEFAYKKGNSAVKFTVAEIHPKTNDQEMQEELDELLKLFAVELTHSGVSHYTYNEKSFVLVGDNVTLRYNFERDLNTNERLSTNVAYNKFKDGDLTLSPYTVWTIQLIKAKPEGRGGFEKLAKFASHVQLELVGKGSYVDEKRFKPPMGPPSVMYSLQYQEMVESKIR